MKLIKLFLLLQLGLLVAQASDYSESILTDLKGVGLELRPLNVKSEQFSLPFDEVESHAYDTLQQLDVRLLSAIELDVMPGQPYLEVSIDVVHAQGPSHLYVVRLELREMARLERPKDRLVKMAVPTWERKVLGVANREEAIVEEMDRLLRLFADEYHRANQPDHGE